jgi:hypothetical protein
LEITLRSIDSLEFFDSFTEWTVDRVGGAETKRVFAIDTSHGAMPEEAPAGIIFHVGRCGSTLVSQLLKCLPRLVVYSEPKTIEDVLRPPHEWNEDQIVSALRLTGKLFAGHARGRYVLKLRSANTLFCDLILRAFPQTPWIFCVRDPLEVAVAFATHLRPVVWFKRYDDPKNPFRRYMRDEHGRDCSREVYIARMYSALCHSIGQLDQTRGRIVEYCDLPDVVWSVVAPHFGFSVGQSERATMAARALMHTKVRQGAIAFESDALVKWKSASEELKSAVDLHARPALADLLRLASG